MKKLQNQHTCQLISAGWKALGKGLFSKELLLTKRSLPACDGGDRVTHESRLLEDKGPKQESRVRSLPGSKVNRASGKKWLSVHSW